MFPRQTNAEMAEENTVKSSNKRRNQREKENDEETGLLKEPERVCVCVCMGWGGGGWECLKKKSLTYYLSHRAE